MHARRLNWTFLREIRRASSISARFCSHCELLVKRSISGPQTRVTALDSREERYQYGFMPSRPETQNLHPAQRLTLLRKRLGLTQRQLAKEFQVSFSAISQWEAGSRAIPGPVVKLIDLYEGSLEKGSKSCENSGAQRIFPREPRRGCGQGSTLIGKRIFVIC